MSTTQSLPLVDGPVTFAGAIGLEVASEYVRPWRLPFDALDLFHPGLVERAGNPAGVRLTLVSDTGVLTVEVQPQAGEAGSAWQYDLLVDGEFHQRVSQPSEQGAITFTDIPAGEHRLEVWLYHVGVVQVRRVLIDAGASARRFEDTRPRWLTYGSSITHCGAAAGPSETWPGIVATRYDLNLTCMGYGGNCHIEPMVARVIRDLPADYITLKLGINVQGGSTLSSRTFREMVIGMVSIIREKHPTTPMAIVSPVLSPPREVQVNPAGLNLQMMRELNAEAVERLRGHGDEHLHYVDGLQLMLESDLPLMPDALHPNADGYRLMGRRFGDIVMPLLGVDSRIGAGA